MSAPRFSGPINGPFLQPWIKGLRYGYMANEPQSLFLGFATEKEANNFQSRVNWAFWTANVGSINDSVSPYGMFKVYSYLHLCSIRIGILESYALMGKTLPVSVFISVRPGND